MIGATGAQMEERNRSDERSMLPCANLLIDDFVNGLKGKILVVNPGALE